MQPATALCVMAVGPAWLGFELLFTQNTSAFQTGARETCVKHVQCAWEAGLVN